MGPRDPRAPVGGRPVTAVDRTAREIGLALGDCGSSDASTLVEEIAAVLAELADEPPRRGRRRRKFRGPGPKLQTHRETDIDSRAG